ncbi:hypothetical protein [Runella zeae]|uniref:hypothetical protein n=1 Tax=Runella zeae TaxID=94255 RepID=UPI00042887D5|nr:hypothetical protein [Runella zeae]
MALSSAQFKERVDKARQNADIKLVIESTGAHAVYSNAAKGDYTYHAPYREDSSPSLRINVLEQRFYDFGKTEARGDVIELVRLIFGKGDKNAMPFFKALEWLERFSGSSVAPIAIKTTQRPKYEPVEVSHEGDRFTFVKAVPVSPKTHPNNLDYIVNTRKISLAVASRHLYIITYKDHSAPFDDPLRGNRYGIGGPNDAQGWEVRAPSANSKFKTSLGTKDITTFVGNQNAIAGDIFEGRMDFLTSLELKGGLQPENPTVILNSGRFAARAAEVIKTRPEWANIKYWRIWQQNDDEGEKSTQVICNELGGDYTVGTLNHYWEGYNDLNKWWTDAPDQEHGNLTQLLRSTATPTKFYDSSATAEMRRANDRQRENIYNPKLF